MQFPHITNVALVVVCVAQALAAGALVRAYGLRFGEGLGDAAEGARASLQVLARVAALQLGVVLAAGALNLYLEAARLSAIVAHRGFDAFTDPDSAFPYVVRETSLLVVLGLVVPAVATSSIRQRRARVSA